eukprot:scaffold69573_cov46-Cyclotella_meneghiniana.AAC.1
MNSNLILVSPFIILTMRHWNSPAAVIWMYRPTPSRAWCERLRVAQGKKSLPTTEKPACGDCWGQ